MYLHKFIDKQHPDVKFKTQISKKQSFSQSQASVNLQLRFVICTYFFQSVSPISHTGVVKFNKYVPILIKTL